MIMHTPWTISLAARLIPSTPGGVVPTPKPWHRAPRGGSQPRRGQGHRGSRGPVAGGMLLWLLPAGPWRAEDLGWGSPTPSSPVSTTTDGLVMAVYLVAMAADLACLLFIVYDWLRTLSGILPVANVTSC